MRMFCANARFQDQVKLVHDRSLASAISGANTCCRDLLCLGHPGLRMFSTQYSKLFLKPDTLS